MSKYDFDEVIDRRGSGCIEHDGAPLFKKPEGLLSMWVADMDFRSPDPVRKSLKEWAEFGIFGYSMLQDSYYEALEGWFAHRHGLDIKKEWVVTTPGVVFALSMAVRALTRPGDSVIICRPVYYPFSSVIEGNDRNLINSPLVLKEGRYQVDYGDFEKKIVENGVKLFILCSPHNPVGRVWTEEELKKIGEICLAHDVKVVADEIHCDFVWSDHPHTPFITVDDRFRDITVTCTAPSKTFNLAGLQLSNIIIPDPAMRKAFSRQISSTGMGGPSCMGMAACEAAYRQGGEWLDQLKDYLRGNIDFLRGYLEENIPEVKLIEPEGTYLLWLDMRDLGMNEEELEKFITDAGLWFDGGGMFGPEGAGFQRLNAACPRSVIKEALEKIKQAIAAR